MTPYVVVYDYTRPHRGGNLNVRQLLNSLFYSHDVRHPDSKRQRAARRRSKDYRVARMLKARYVPLYQVDRTVYLLDRDWLVEKAMVV
jgi:hypothetical protein